MGPENRFIHRVHKRLDKSVYREKMHNAYRGGTPDVWYSGKNGDCWIEYKWGRLNLSPLQLKWLTDRDAEGRRCFVVVGTPKGAEWMWLPEQWRGEVKVDKLITDQHVAELIELVCK